MDWVKNIQRCFDFDRVFYTQHARVEMRNEVFGEIKDNEVYEAIRSAGVIQEYPKDKPYPSEASPQTVKLWQHNLGEASNVK